MTNVDLDRRALALFEAMLEQAEDRQESWLFEQVEGDEALRERVTEILVADRHNSLRTGAAAQLLDPEPPPERIGAYRITGQIGAGGMGSVYAAERDRGDFSHSVAIKLIKPGILSDALITRFNRERQILAQLNHPHIARLFDGGTTEDGQPYFVMERVAGVPLLDWLERERPDEARRLALFEQVCEAAAHAHRNLIVHRDLTLSNILVEPGDQAKLIDFGIARPDGEEVAEATAGAAPLRLMTLTPGYAAPERLRGDAATTLSDIYSAGRMLARMVGRPRPPEIQSIIAKATARDPEDRYLSMDQLAEDIERYRAGRPVGAMPGGKLYRLRKWALRNKPLAVLNALLLLAILAGVGATGWYWQRAEAARAVAEHRFDEVRSIAKFMLFDLYDDLQPVNGNTKALSRIADEARGYLERLGSDENLSSDLRFEIAQGYHRLSTVSGNPEGANLGRREDARRFLDKAIVELQALRAADPANPVIAQALAEAHYSDAILRFIAEEDNEGAIAAGDRAAALYRELMNVTALRADYRLGWYRARLQAAKPLVWIDRGAEGVERLAALRDEVAAYLPQHPDDFDTRRLFAGINSQLGYTRAWHLGTDHPDLASSLPPMDRAVAIYSTLFREAPPPVQNDLRTSLIAALFERSLVLSDLARWQEALADLDRAEGYADHLVREDPDDSGAVRRRESLHSQKIFVLAGLGRNAEAVALALGLQRARVVRAQASPDNAGYARDAANSRQSYADMLKEAGQRALACRTYREAEAAWTSIEQRWSLSSIDRDYNIAPLKDEIAACQKPA